jgi:hypothetical protein
LELVGSVVVGGSWDTLGCPGPIEAFDSEDVEDGRIFIVEDDAGVAADHPAKKEEVF